MPPTDHHATDAFIAKWQGVTASELSTSQSFLSDLCRLLDVDTPHPTPAQDYMFERPITFVHGDGSTSAGRIDLYKRGAFVLESKKLKAGSHTRGFDDAMLRARSQAEGYARALPASEGRPPFVIVVDVGRRIELYSEFTRTGATYVPFPDPRSHRIALDDLRDANVRERLRKLWTDPLALDPSREAARVTRAIAAQLADLARSLERAGHAADRVAQFLMRCLFTMFAEDVRLLPEHSFRDLLDKHGAQPDVAMRMLAQLWRDMDAGGFSAAIAHEVLKFNGKLFKDPDTLPLDAAQIALLLQAAKAKWEHVEPAIFGTLLERALDSRERHKLGAHYTPRAYVERLVLPTVIEPLRTEWSDAQAAALTLAAEGNTDEAVATLRRFHHRLCALRVLDPACGSGNFLYVTLEHLKRLEGEVLNALDEFGFRQTGLALAGERADAAAGETVDPHNLLGIELNPRAAAIAEVVLWIGYLQWHFRTRGDVTPPVPVIRDFRNIEHRDAVLACDRVENVLDARGIPVMRWDGRTMKTSPITGEQIPDDTARVPLQRYVNPRKAAWPRADFVVGNPPFIGSKRMREVLGDGYVDAIQEAWPEIPQATDFVMRWWHMAALLTRHGALQRFGLITTNSLRQSYVRRAVEPHLQGDPPLSIVFAVPDHPWVDSADGAAVRIAMTAGESGSKPGRLLEVVAERNEAEEGNDDLVIALHPKIGRINADLSVGIDVTKVVPLLSNADLCSVGMKTIGGAFQIDAATANALGLGRIAGLENHIRPYFSGRDFAGTARGIYIVDFYGMEAEEVRAKFPEAYQHLLERAKPERDHNRNPIFRERWWVIGHPRQQFRKASAGLSRYIATIETSKHRFFAFVPQRIAPDSTLVTVASDDALLLGLLSSEVHVLWALATGGTLEDRPRYNKTRCFETFPFPAELTEAHAPKPSPSRGGLGGDGFRADATTPEDQTHPHPGLPLEGEGEKQKHALAERIRTLAEHLDAHRKRQQAQHPDLTLTGMYNVLEKLRSGGALTAKERTIHEHGLVSVLRQLHDDLDAAVLAAYGWFDLLPLLRIAHGNTAVAVLPPLREGRSRHQAAEGRADEGTESPLATEARRSGEDAPSSGAARLPQGEGRAEARRTFDDTILERLVALNAQRAAEEARGLVRWLRPQFQQPATDARPEQQHLDTTTDDDTATTTPVATTTTKPQPWPKDTIDQVRAVADLLAASPVPLSLDAIATRFTARGPWKKRLPQLLDMLVALGRAQQHDGAYSAM